MNQLILPAQFGNFFALVCGVDFGEVVDEFSVAKEKGFPVRFFVGADDLEGITNFPIDVREEGEGEAEFVREGFLVCHGVHRDSDDLDLFFGESGRGSLQRFDLFGSPEFLRDRIEENWPPAPRETMKILMRSRVVGNSNMLRGVEENR